LEVYFKVLSQHLITKPEESCKAMDSTTPDKPGCVCLRDAVVLSLVQSCSQTKLYIKYYECLVTSQVAEHQMKWYSDYNNPDERSCGPLAHPNIFGSTEEKGKTTKI
jgi:hypothetical protein